MNRADIILVNSCRDDSDFAAINTPRGMTSKKAFDILVREEKKQSVGDRLKLCNILVAYNGCSEKEIVSVDTLNDILFCNGESICGYTNLKSLGDFKDMYSEYMRTGGKWFYKTKNAKCKSNKQIKKKFVKQVSSVICNGIDDATKEKFSEELSKNMEAQEEQPPVKRKRGRPKGSKNKPKVTPVAITSAKESIPIAEEMKAKATNTKEKETKNDGIDFDAIAKLAAELAAMDIQKENEKEQAAKEHVSRKVSIHDDGIEPMAGNNLGSLLKGIDINE